VVRAGLGLVGFREALDEAAEFRVEVEVIGGDL